MVAGDATPFAGKLAGHAPDPGTYRKLLEASGQLAFHPDFAVPVDLAPHLLDGAAGKD